MKHLLLKTWLALVCLLLGVGTGWAEDATMAAGTNGSSATVNDKAAIKVGTSKAGGVMTITVPAGATSLEFYAAAWNGVTGLSLKIAPEANVSPTSVSLTADAGISGNSPFTLAGTESSYKFTVALSNITAETKLTFTSSSAKRFVVWGATYTTSNGDDGGGSTPETPTLEAPTFDVTAGTYTEDQHVLIDNYNSDYIYVYTIDGSDPAIDAELHVTNGFEYDNDEGIEITSSCTLKVIAVDENGNTSSITSAAYVFPLVFASLEELVAADLTSGTLVTVSFENVAIKDIFVTTQGYRNGVYFDIQKGGKDIEIFNQNVPEDWVVGGTLSGTMTCPWKIYSGTWELAPDKGTWAWESLTYTAPVKKTITALEVSGTPVKTNYNVGDAFETEGLVVTATYSDKTTATITEGFVWTIDYGKGNAAFVAGATTVDVKASTEEVESEVYTVNGITVTVPVTLTSIAISGTPTKTEYYAGDAFETAGLVVTGTYSDSHTEVISEGINWTVDPETLTLGVTSVDVVASVDGVDSKSFTVNDLTVVKPDFETVTYNFSSFTSGQVVELTDLVGFVITLSKAEGTSNPAWSSNQARVYANGTLSVKANNATIKSIEYTYVINENKSGNAPTISGVAGTTVAGTWNEEAKTWTGADDEVTFSTTGTAGNIGFTKLVIKYVEKNLISTTLAWSAEEAEVTLGAEDNAFPTLTTDPANLDGVTYESSNTAVATIDEDGSIVILKAGETTITARYEGDEEHAPATPASYTLTVTKAPFVPVPVEEGYETADLAGEYADVTTNAVAETYEGTSFAIAFAKPESSSTPTKYYDNGKAIRAYTGNTLTITAAEEITGVNVAWAAGGYADEAATTEGLGTKTVVVTFSKSCRFTDVTVYYNQSSIDLTATDGESSYATFSSDKAVEFDDAEVYTVTVEDGVLSLNAVENNLVPANTGVLVKSSAKKAAFHYVLYASALNDNMLRAASAEKETDGSMKFYMLAYASSEKDALGFYWGAAEGASFNSRVGSAYLAIPASAGAVKGFSFAGTETSIQNLMSENGNSTVYNLMGQRVNANTKGIIVVNGKKMLNK